MKTTLLKRLCRMAAIFICAACVYACSEDEPAATDTPQPETPQTDPDKGEVSFVINHEGGSGAGTAASPAEVANGDTLTMVISQKSSYTDTDGTVYSCEPEATISLNAVRDTVYAQNEGLLTQLEEGSDVSSSTSGTDPVTHLMEQVFHIGNQQIRFNLGYEVYTYVNKANQAIEMPYIKLNQANFGSASSDESETEARAQTKATAEV